MQRTLAILVQNPFSERDFKRYGVSTLRRNGFTVEIWDASAFMRSPQTDQPSNDPGLHPITTLADLKHLLESIDISSTLLFNSVNLSTLSLPLFRTLASCALKSCTFAYSFVAPSPLPPLKRLKRFMTSHPVLVLNHLVGALPRKLLPVRTPDVRFVVGGVTALPPSGHNGQTIIAAHSFDYDSHLAGQDAPALITTPYIAFIDECIPFSKDYTRSFIKRAIKPDEYYTLLNAVFDHMENLTGLPVVIAAHPDSTDAILRNFGNRKTCRNNTQNIVRQSSLVLLHFSTAVTFPVLYAKPIVFLTADALKGSIFSGYIDKMAETLGHTPVNLNRFQSFRRKPSDIPVDRALYSRYINNYVKVPGTPELASWQIFADVMNQSLWKALLSGRK